MSRDLPSLDQLENYDPDLVTRIYSSDGEILDEKSPSKFRYIKEIIGENSAVLEFESEIDGIYVNGIDLISWNDENKITEFKVIVRPLQAVNKLHQQMQDMLEQMKTA